ncbi:MAG: hypothetical protein AAGU19_15595 [Prolixibacteraceae bacterium]
MTTAQLQHKEWIYNLVEKGSHGKKRYLVFDYIITALILLSVFAIIGESVADINARYGTFLSHFENFCLIVFSFEYLMSGFIAVLGIGLVALPTGLISAGFINKVNSRKKGHFCPHCGKRVDDH